MTLPEVSSELELEDFGVRFRVWPTRIQQQVLKRWIVTQRYIYNRKVEELEYQLRLRAISNFSNRFEAPEVQYAQWDQSFAKYKDPAPWMTEIPSFVRRNSCSRFGLTFSRFGSPSIVWRSSGRYLRNLLKASCLDIGTAESVRVFPVPASHATRLYAPRNTSKNQSSLWVDYEN